MRGPGEVLPRAGGRAEHRRGERAGERTGVPFPAQRQGADTRERRGSYPEGQVGRSIGGSIENLIVVINIIIPLGIKYITSTHSPSVGQDGQTGEGFFATVLQVSRKVECRILEK